MVGDFKAIPSDVAKEIMEAFDILDDLLTEQDRVRNGNFPKYSRKKAQEVYRKVQAVKSKVKLCIK